MNQAASKRLRDELATFAAGPERTVAQAKNIELLARRVQSPWRDELLFVTANYAPRDEATGERALIALAQLILSDWGIRKQAPRWRLGIPDDAKGLHKRWYGEAGEERAMAVSIALATGNLSDLAFGEHEGRLDFRGYLEPEVAPGRRVAELEAVDFSGAKFRNLHFHNRTIRGCRFDGVDFRDLRFWSSTILETSFVGSRFGDFPVLSGVTGRPARHCTFRRVDFRRANLSYVMPERVLFEDCDFSDAKLYRANFQSDLVRCRFAGWMDDVTFWGRRWGPWLLGRWGKWVLRDRLRLEELDFSNAEFHAVGFRAIDVSTLRLPSDPSLRVVSNWPCVYDRLKRRFSATNELEMPLSVRFALIRDPSGMPKHGAAVLEMDTFKESGAADSMDILEQLLDEAKGSCGQ
jgi:uncharacterized protein YjbI with pentapeptide repeats